MEWFERHRGNVAASLLVVVAVVAFAVLQVPRRPALQVVSTVPPTLVPIKVHVAGAVRAPGVYQLPPDARVEDALKAAGGAAEPAETSSLNLATPLKDGQQLVIPLAASVPFAAPASSTPSSAPVSSTMGPAPTMLPGLSATALQTVSSGRTNLNTATRQELEALPGIGTVFAGRILEWRTAHGGFTSIEELRDSKILNASTYDKVKGLVEVR